MFQNKLSAWVNCYKIEKSYITAKKIVKNANLTSSANSKFAKLNESANSRNANPRLLDLEIISNYKNKNLIHK